MSINSWEQLYAKPLDCKKNILEYIDIIEQYSKNQLNKEEIEENYALIEDSIIAMSERIKPNTILQLRKALDGKLGQFKTHKIDEEQDCFLKFFQQAYPKNKRYKDYTWVLMDINRISDEQLLHTLKYINAWCFKNKLTEKEKKAIIDKVGRLVERTSLKYINQLKSLEGLNKGLGIKIIENNNRFEIIRHKASNNKCR